MPLKESILSAPTSPSAKEQNFLTDTLSRTKRAFVYVAIFSLCINILMLALPLYSLQVLDRVMSSRSMNTLLMLTLVVIACFAFYSLFSAIRATVLNRIGEWLENTLSPKLLADSIAKSAVGQPVSASQHHRDLAYVKNFITGMGISTLFDAPWSVIYILVIYMINPILGFVTVIGCVLLFLFAVITEYSTKKPLNNSSRVNIQSLGIAESASRNAEIIESMGMTGNLINNWEKTNAKNIEFQNIATSRNNIIQSLSRFIRMILQISMIGIGAVLALNNEMSVGGMIAASILNGRALAPFDASITVWKSFILARDAYSRMKQSIGSSKQLRGTMRLPAPQGHVKVENLFYRAPNSEKPILKGVNFQLNPGESLGIIGPSAAGKSTLAKLLIGIMIPSHGTVRLDGAEIFKWNREDIGQYVGYLPQDVELFTGSVRDNIARMEPNPDDAKVIAAAQFAGVHDLILQLPAGYETIFSAGNVSLSPGQRQRIGLARALYCNPRYIVLDEPNSNLDGEGERALLDCLNRVRANGVTAIIVAHRPSIVSGVDKILMLRDGVVEQFGPREQVLQKYTGPAPVRPTTPPQLAQEKTA